MTPRDPLREGLEAIRDTSRDEASSMLAASMLGAMDARAALASSTQDAEHPNRWTTQELIDIYDRTADRPDIRAKIGKWVRP